MNQGMIAADDKVLHCISRMLQEGIAEDEVKCLYCKYAPECREAFKENGQVLFVDIVQELARRTSVAIILNPETKQKELLRGSWIKEYPELLKKFTNMSFDEQLDNLHNPDILTYLRNPGL